MENEWWHFKAPFDGEHLHIWCTAPTRYLAWERLRADDPLWFSPDAEFIAQECPPLGVVAAGRNGRFTRGFIGTMEAEIG